MKFSVSTFLVFLASVAAVQAQSYITLAADTSFTSGDPSEIHKAEVVVSNTGPNPQTMVWQRIKNDIPEGWETSVCDPNLCWAPFADAPGYGWAMANGDNDNFYVQFDARNLPDGPALAGEGIVDVVIYSEEDSANYNATGVFVASLSGVGFYSPDMDKVFEAYPNPAVHTLQLMASYNSDVVRIQLVNLVGKVVLSESWNAGNGRMTLDVSQLPEGVYFVQFLDANQVLKTKKISISR